MVPPGGRFARRNGERLEHLIARGLPSDVFLWPIDLDHRRRRPGFRLRHAAARCPLRPARHADGGRKRLRLARGVRRRPSNWPTRSWPCTRSGLCYADISFGNVFLEPNSGAVQICDNDNVAIDGAGTGVLGTPYFMAPEVVRGEAVPSVPTDRFSLAVLLFCLLTRHHPLLGAREQRDREPGRRTR